MIFIMPMRGEGGGLFQSATICSEFHGTAPILGEHSLDRPIGPESHETLTFGACAKTWFEIGGVAMASW